MGKIYTEQQIKRKFGTNNVIPLIVNLNIREVTPNKFEIIKPIKIPKKWLE